MAPSVYLQASGRNGPLNIRVVRSAFGHESVIDTGLHLSDDTARLADKLHKRGYAHAPPKVTKRWTHIEYILVPAIGR